MRTILQLSVMAGAALALGAGSAYAPRGASGWNDGYRSSTTGLRGGFVEVASFGLVELTPDDTPAMSTLHVRLVVANESDRAPWAFDVSKVTLELGRFHEAATLANSDLATLPIAILDRGERATIDAYFELPPPPADLSHFGVTWQVSTGAGVRLERTRFVVDDQRPPFMSIEHRVGWGSIWWFDPAHEWSRFYHRAGTIVPRPPTHVLVTRPPVRHAMPSTS
ncbi:MAG TPA: hypothetical protein VLT45_08095 [Kofleriaceae bacterium]|nr:hypothetical protein [Kofleriaceae bacterium]